MKARLGMLYHRGITTTGYTRNAEHGVQINFFDVPGEMVIIICVFVMLVIWFVLDRWPSDTGKIQRKYHSGPMDPIYRILLYTSGQLGRFDYTIEYIIEIKTTMHIPVVGTVFFTEQHITILCKQNEHCLETSTIAIGFYIICLVKNEGTVGNSKLCIQAKWQE